MEENQSAPPEQPVVNEAPKEDLLSNFKHEVNRKLENTNAQLQQLLNAINSQQQTRSTNQPTKKVSVFEDEDAFAATVKAEATAEIKREMAAERAALAKQQQTIGSLTAEFPELTDGNHQFTKRAIEIYNALPEDERANTSLAYKAAVKEAALELDMKPLAKRKSPKADDDFVMGGSGGAPVSKAEASKLEKIQEELAQKMGIKLSPEAKQRLKTKHGRKSYNSWE